MPGCGMHSRPKLAEKARYNSPVAKLEDMLVMHCMTNDVLEYHFYLKIPSKNCSSKRSPLCNNKVYSKKPCNFVLNDDFS